jgi:ribose-phosphate pyrophosphokinase
MIKVATYDGKGWPQEAAYHKFKFPAGELQVTVRIKPGDLANIDFEYENNEEILELLLIADAIKRSGGTIRKITIPYIPFGRQDRIMNNGEAFSLKVFADLLNSIGAEIVETVDPHSDVTRALINNITVIEQSEIFAHRIKNLCREFHLVYPDSGASKKIHKMERALVEVGAGDNMQETIPADKIRDVATGKITGTKVFADNLNPISTYIIVDDICDGGRTFIELAKELRKKGAKNIILMVTFGLFTQGMGVFDGLIDEIYDRKGRVL